MPDPKSLLISFPLDLGIDVVSDPERVSPMGDRPRLTQSVNTRLTKSPGRVTKSPASASLASGLSRAGGVVPCGRLDSKVVFAHPGDAWFGGPGGNLRVAGSTVDQLAAWNNGNDLQSYFFPAEVSQASQLPAGGSSFMTPSVCYDESTGYTYFASYVDYPVGANASAIAVTVIGDDGRLVVAPKVVLDFTTDAKLGRFMAITCHGAGIVRLWYQNGATNALLVTAVSILNLTLTIGGPSTLFVPSAVTVTSVALATDPLDTTNVYIVCFAAAGTNARVLRVNPQTLTVTTGVDVATGGDANTSHAVAYVYDGTTRRLTMMASWAAGNCSLFQLDATTLATTWSATNRMSDAQDVSCGFLRTAFIDVLVFACSRVGTVSNITTPGGTQFEFRTPATGALVDAADLPWHQLVGQIATLKVTDTQHYPLIAAQVVYDGISRYNPTDENYVSDPAIEIVTPQYISSTAEFDWSLRGRFGADFCVRYPGYNLTPAYVLGGCNSFVCNGMTARLVYLAENTDEVNAPSRSRPVRYVSMDFSPGQPPYALLSAGQAIVGGAMPAVWDGAELTELSPIRAPKIFGTATGGTGASLTGTFLFAAVVSWRDASGQVHRSPPSNIITLSPAATQVALYVTRPVTYRAGKTQPKFSVTIYASQDAGTTLYAQTYPENTATSTAYWLHFLAIGTPAQSALTPALYSDESPATVKANYCPNAYRAARVIADRVWLIDGERPNIAFYSQPMSTEVLAGIFPSFNPTQRVEFPAAAGELVNVENWREAPMFFTGTGVWTVDGEGPSALNDPPAFSAPRQVSDYPCTDAKSVVLTPVGIMFRSRNRFVLLAGADPVVFDDVAINTPIVGCAVFRDFHEIVFVTESQAFVFNYKNHQTGRGGWTVWDATTFDVTGSMSSAVQDPFSDNLIYYSPDDEELLELDPVSVSATAQITLETGWVIPGGPQDDSTLQNVVARIARGGTHGVTLRISTDYDSSQPAKVYSSAEVTAMLRNSRYDLWPEPRDMPARGARLSLVETGATGEGMQGISVTMEMVRNAGKLAQSLRQSGRK